MIATDYELITNAAELRAGINELSKHQVIGLDTETTSLNPYEGRMRLVQLSAPDGVRIVDLYSFAPGELKTGADLAPLRDLLAAARPVKVAQVTDGQALIDSGLQANEQVVVDGQYKLQAGTRVTLLQGKAAAEAIAQSAQQAPIP